MYTSVEEKYISTKLLSSIISLQLIKGSKQIHALTLAK
jgi:hypothetical protein